MITSIQNAKVKKWRKLHQRKERMKDRAFLIEGEHLLEEAVSAGAEIREVITAKKKYLPQFLENVNITEVSNEVFTHISRTEAPQGIAAVIGMNTGTQVTGARVLLIDAVQDPGNLGTMIRTADAAGFDAVVLGAGTVDVYNDKVIRATQGSLFHIPVMNADLAKTAAGLKEQGFCIWAAALDQAKVYNQIHVPEKIALIVGNEGAGIRGTMINQADEIVTIPIYGRAESLNVSVAAGILMYHIRS